MTLPAIPAIVDEDRYQRIILSAPITQVDLEYPVFATAGVIDVYIDGVLQAEDSWSLTSISGTDLESVTLPLEDGRIVFDTATASTGTVEIVYRWSPRATTMATAAGISRREYNFDRASMIAALREGRRDINEVVGLLSDFSAYAAVSPDAVGPEANLTDHDDEAAGYIYLATDDASGAPVIYVKLSATTADWSAALTLRGASGAAGATGDTGYKFAVAGGTVDALTATFSPAVTSYTNGLTVIVECAGANTSTTPTLAANALSGKTIVKGSNSALVAGDIPGANFHGIFTFDASLDKWVMQNPAKGVSIDAAKYAGKRQCANYGPKTTAGLPDFLPATDVDLTLSTQNLTTTPLVVTAAQGANSSGASNRIGYSAANFSWTLTDSATNYLGVTVGSDGTLTAFKTTTAPVYVNGTAASVSVGVYTFDISTMTMYLGDGAAANAVWAVFLGEAVASGGAVTSTVAYAYNGFYEYTDTSNLPGTATSTTKQHNIGVSIGIVATISVVCQSTEFGFAAGDVVTPVSTNNGSTSPAMATRCTNKAISFTTGSTGAFVVPNAAAGTSGVLTAANWRYRLTVVRQWG